MEPFRNRTAFLFDDNFFMDDIPFGHSLLELQQPPDTAGGAASLAPHIVARSLFDRILVPTAVLDDEGVVLDVNRAWREAKPETPYYGVEIGDNCFDFLRKRSSKIGSGASGLSAVREGAMKLGAYMGAEFHHTFAWNKGNVTQWFNARAVRIAACRPASEDEEKCESLVLQFEDVSERKHAEDELRRSNAILEATQEAAAEGIFLVDRNGLLVRFNRRFVELWNIDPDRVEQMQENHELLSFVLDSLEDPDEFIERIGYLYDHPHESARDEISLKDGRIFDRYSAPAISAQGDYYGRVWSFADISARKADERRLAHQAFHDPLTGLPNRALFSDRLERALARARRHNQFIAVLFLDLDRFKLINDSLGHEAGDQLLIALSQRLRARMRPEDTAARLGGDEFTILLEDIDNVEAAAHVAERIAEDLRVPFKVGGREVFSTSSIGIAISDGIRHAPDDLMRNADAAMYLAKASGKAHYEVFEEALTSRALERLELESDLRRAIARNEFEVFYQPIIALETNRVCGHEALLRWNRPTHGMVLPSEFIALAEETGLIIQIGAWVLREACRQTEIWQRAINQTDGERAEPLSISVNLSARQFEQPDLVSQVAKILRETDLQGSQLELEITESVVMRDIGTAMETLLALKKLGVRLAIDDFGTGYSSLAYLKQFPVDTLKIDRSFIAGMTGETTLTSVAARVDGDGAIVRAVISLAETFGVAVTAEGVETAAQLTQLRGLNCESGQGFLFAHPRPASEISPLEFKKSVEFQVQKPE